MRVKLGDIATIQMGQSPLSSTYNNYGKGLPFYQGITEFGEKYPTKKTYTTSPIRIAEKGDILFSVRAPVGEVNIATEKCCVGRGNASIRMNSRNQEYLYYLLKANKKAFLNITTGSVFESVSGTDLRNFEVNIEDETEQKRIANILSSFDNKIEQLKKENNILENIAQSIFKEWFVKYNFPNNDGKPYRDSGGKMIDSELGLIPDGWRVGKLGDVVNTVNGYSYKGSELRKSDFALVTLKNFDRNGGFKENGLKEFIGNPSTEQEVKKGDLAVAHTDLTQDGEVLGNPILIPTTKYTKLYITMDCVKVTPKKDLVSKEFLYYLMLRPEFKGYCLGYANGTTVLHLPKKAILEYKYSIPQNNYHLLNLFNELAANQREVISQNIQRTNTLIKSKNNLLNKLIK